MLKEPIWRHPEVPMSRIQLEIPDEVLFALKIPEGRAEEELRREFAVFLVKEGLLPRPQARKVARMDRLAFDYLLAQRQVPVDMRPGELREDLEAGLRALSQP